MRITHCIKIHPMIKCLIFEESHQLYMFSVFICWSLAYHLLLLSFNSPSLSLALSTYTAQKHVRCLYEELFSFSDNEFLGMIIHNDICMI